MGRPAQRSSGAPQRSSGAARPARPSERRVEPPLPDDAIPSLLDREVRADLSGLAKDNAEVVARHLVMAGRLLEEDPEAAYAHASAAQQRAGRIGVVREAAGITAYAAGRYADSLRELRTARRLTGSNVHLPLMADCERGLGRPERALELASSAEAATLDPAGAMELRLVVAGARLDLGQADAAVLALECPELHAPAPRQGAQPWRARLFSAYADALAAAGRGGEARSWLQRAAQADPAGDTGARGRLDALDGRDDPDDEDVVVFDLLDDAVTDEPGDSSVEQPADQPAEHVQPSQDRG